MRDQDKNDLTPLEREQKKQIEALNGFCETLVEVYGELQKDVKELRAMVEALLQASQAERTGRRTRSSGSSWRRT